MVYIIKRLAISYDYDSDLMVCAISHVYPSVFGVIKRTQITIKSHWGRICVCVCVSKAITTNLILSH